MTVLMADGRQKISTSSITFSMSAGGTRIHHAVWIVAEGLRLLWTLCRLTSNRWCVARGDRHQPIHIRRCSTSKVLMGRMPNHLRVSCICRGGSSPPVCRKSWCLPRWCQIEAELRLKESVVTSGIRLPYSRSVSHLFNCLSYRTAQVGTST